MNKYQLLGTLYYIYPPVLCLSDRINSDDFKQALAQYKPGSKPLCLYFHFPFCKKKCHYCYSFTMVGKDEAYVSKYIGYLKKNIDLAVHNSDVNMKKINAMFWGGGTPTYLTVNQIKEIYQYISRHFEFEDDAEISVEIDSRVTDKEKIETLYSLGVNRLSFGVQDINRKVLKSINRLQDINEIKNQINFSRSIGIHNINIDLVFGLPNQSIDDLNKTLDWALELNPAQITFNTYVHLPFLAPNQQAIKDEMLPNEEGKLEMLYNAEEKFLKYGYKNYAFQHYTKSKDDLWRYYNHYIGSLDGECLAFGVRATSFVNNVRVYFWDDIDKYYHMLDNHEFPVFKGFKNNKDDSLRSYVMKYFQANQGIVKKVIEDAYGIDFDSYFAKELNKLREMEEDGLITMDDDIINLTQKGKIYITNILMVFDQYPHWKEIFQFKSEEAETA